jgi:hypothetical protein
LLLLVLGCTSSRNLPQKIDNYAASLILPGSDSPEAVVKEYDAELRISAEDNAVYSVHKVVTILKPGAREHGRLVLEYGGFQHIRNIKGGIYNKDGVLVRYLNEDEGMDIGLTDGYSLYDDSRIKIYHLYYDKYPYTIVYDYSIQYSGLLNLPSFFPQGPKEYVKQARFKLQAPATQGVRYRALNIQQNPHKSLIGKDSLYSWELQNLEPVANEPLNPPFMMNVSRVLIAPDRFRMANSTGRLDSWNSFGKWYYSLTVGRNELPLKVQQKVKNIYFSADNREQGIKALYEYMQRKTRYVSIQLGIGGWQPFKASFVEKNGYGDCKALTNYMQTILKYAGVDSYPVLIRNGIGVSPVITDFPSNQFNHEILYVPGKKPIWLESTGQSIPFNYIGISNANRYGLLIKPDSSFLIKTPEYDYKTNKLKNETKVNLNSQGKADIKVKATYSGAFLDDIIGNTAQKSDQQREKWLHKTISLNGFSIRSYDFSEIDNKRRKPSISVNLTNDKYATRMQSRLFVPLNSINKWKFQVPEMQNKRTQDVILPFSFQEVDHTTLHIPSGFKVETMPENIRITTSFGTYTLTVTSTGESKLEILRKLTITKQHLQADTYSDLRNFFSEIAKGDSKSVIFRLREGG